jgi:hypothetical protein
MPSSQRKYVKYVLILILLNGLLIGLLNIFGKNIFEYNASRVGIVLAISMFFVYENFIIIYTENKSKSLSSRQSVNLFLGFKAGKIILSLLFITIYALAVKVELKRFVLVFVVLYFIYLLFDTIYMVTREKKLKTKQYHCGEPSNDISIGN